ncbi:MAG: hypothetical protein QW567_01145 [Candidatus Hadarchaeales archaeon]
MREGGLAASDLIRSMLREGYSGVQIYEVLTGAGLRGEAVQMLIDRVMSEIPDGGDKKPKLTAELEGMRTVLEELREEVMFLRRAFQLMAMHFHQKGRKSRAEHASAYKRGSQHQHRQ